MWHIANFSVLVRINLYWCDILSVRNFGVSFYFFLKLLVGWFAAGEQSNTQTYKPNDSINYDG
jgi:hypothetical protein